MESVSSNPQIPQHPVSLPYDLDQLRDKYAEQKQVNSKFLKNLNKRPPKDLDKRIHQIHDEVFAQTDCLACANCCKTTGPLFTTRDIKRISKHLGMGEAEFEDQYLRIDEDNDWVLQQLPCPFLEQDNRCAIYDHRPKACREFPHTNRVKFHQITSLTQKNMAICPAAFAIIERMRNTHRN